MKKLEIGNIGTGNTSTLATISRLLAVVVLLASGGCQMKEFASTPLHSGDEVRFTGALWWNDDFKGVLPFWWMDNADSFGIFPLYYHDAKKNGYVNTSLLWRLFRYENDPEKGCKVDFLFVPLWRWIGHAKRCNEVFPLSV